jgi:hypothetical protein
VLGTAASTLLQQEGAKRNRRYDLPHHEISLCMCRVSVQLYRLRRRKQDESPGSGADCSGLTVAITLRVMNFLTRSVSTASNWMCAQDAIETARGPKADDFATL